MFQNYSKGFFPSNPILQQRHTLQVLTSLPDLLFDDGPYCKQRVVIVHGIGEQLEVFLSP